jgi:hypothetical protein
LFFSIGFEPCRNKATNHIEVGVYRIFGDETFF